MANERDIILEERRKSLGHIQAARVFPAYQSA
jgi:hypothetical protein